MGGLLSARGLISGFAVGLVVASAGFAIAQDSSTPEGSPPEAPPPASPADPSTPFAGPESLGFIHEEEWRESQGLPPLSEADNVDFAAFGAFKFWADACRERGPDALGMSLLHCEANIALAQGRLQPGEYSDEQLRAELGK